MNETIPLNWQDIATIVGCVSMLALAFWIRRRVQRTRPAGGGCASGSCGSNENRGGPDKVVIPTSSLSLGKRPRS
jgi:hypothetical protein